MAAFSRDETLALVLGRLTDQAQRGESVDIEAVCDQHPDLAVELRQLWGAVMVAAAAGSSHQVVDPEYDPADGVTSPLELPCVFGEYELLEEIGRGGMGVVYRARQTRLRRDVAVKMILRGQLASAVDRERFRTEAEFAARLSHPGIVPVYDVGEVDGQPYFSMQLVVGSTLAERLKAGPVPDRDAAQLVAKMSIAIHYAHRQGVLHRDLKPSNILIDENGEPHVSDFGLAKLVSGPVSLTRSGAVLGTPAYMAPEQATTNASAVGPFSDVYSLGTILYHMLTGRPTFEAASPLDILLMLREQDVVPPRLINTEISRDLEMIVLRCLQKPTDLRYETARALAQDLEAFLADEPISARGGRFVQVLARLFRETHHATVLENWGVLWMWHSLVLFTICALTNALHWAASHQRWYYIVLWTFGLGAWAAVFWWLRRRMGPVTFVERQIAHVWAASMVATTLLFFVEMMLDLPPLSLSAVLALIAGMVFIVKAGILSGWFYIQGVALFGTAFVMARFPDVGHLVFGIVSAICFFVPGLKYYRQRRAGHE